MVYALSDNRGKNRLRHWVYPHTLNSLHFVSSYICRQGFIHKPLTQHITPISSMTPGKNNCYLNSLWPSKAIWQHRTGSTLVQVMACCLLAPSHFLNQCWLIIDGAQQQSISGILMGSTQDINLWNKFENHTLKKKKILSHHPGANELTWSLTTHVLSLWSLISYQT